MDGIWGLEMRNQVPMNVKKAEQVEAKINSGLLKGWVKIRECLLNVYTINIFKCMKFL